MNIVKSAKGRVGKRGRFRLVYEPDYDHEAWNLGAAPTPQSHPQAFDARRERIGPHPTISRQRKVPHERLGIGALKRRLYRAGLTRLRAVQIAREIHAGPGNQDLTIGGAMVMGWFVKTLEGRYGRRIARAVSRFVRAKFILLDEGSSLMASGSMANFIEQGIRAMRKYNTRVLDISQGLQKAVVG